MLFFWPICEWPVNGQRSIREWTVCIEKWINSRKKDTWFQNNVNGIPCTCSTRSILQTQVNTLIHTKILSLSPLSIGQCLISLLDSGKNNNNNKRVMWLAADHQFYIVIGRLTFRFFFHHFFLCLVLISFNQALHT